MHRGTGPRPAAALAAGLPFHPGQAALPRVRGDRRAVPGETGRDAVVPVRRRDGLGCAPGPDDGVVAVPRGHVDKSSRIFAAATPAAVIAGGVTRGAVRAAPPAFRVDLGDAGRGDP